MMMPPVYPLSPPGLSGDGLVRWASELLDAGARLLQYRPAGTGQLELYRNAESLARLCEGRGAALLVNDRADVALMAGAAGVHLGGGDIPPEKARKLLGKDAVIGFSTHCPAEAKAALELPVDYVALGPVFPTGSKPDARPVVSSEMRKEVILDKRLPVVAIGGITPERAVELWKLGFDSVAAIEAFRQEPGRAFREFIGAFRAL